MKTKPFLAAWLTTGIVLFILNGLFHGLLAANFFDSHFSGLGGAAVKMKDFNPVPIVVLEFSLDLFLVLMITGMKNEKIELRNAVITGGLFYLGTALSWNLANTATLVSWPIIVTVVDSLWHLITGLVAGTIIYLLFNRQFKVKS